MNVVIEGMRLEDVSQVIEIERLSFPTPWSRKAFETELAENACACYLVARASGRVIGYAGMWVLIDESHVTNIAVHPHYRRRHVGRALLRELMGRAAARGATAMSLEVRASNVAAQLLYLSEGFVVAGVRKRYYSDTGEDAIIMIRDHLESAVRATGWTGSPARR